MSNVSSGAVAGEEDIVQIGVMIKKVVRSVAGEMGGDPVEGNPGIVEGGGDRVLRGSPVMDGDGDGVCGGDEGGDEVVVANGEWGFGDEASAVEVDYEGKLFVGPSNSFGSEDSGGDGGIFGDDDVVRLDGGVWIVVGRWSEVDAGESLHCAIFVN